MKSSSDSSSSSEEDRRRHKKKKKSSSLKKLEKKFRKLKKDLKKAKHKRRSLSRSSSRSTSESRSEYSRSEQGSPRSNSPSIERIPRGASNDGAEHDRDRERRTSRSEHARRRSLERYPRDASGSRLGANEDEERNRRGTSRHSRNRSRSRSLISLQGRRVIVNKQTTDGAASNSQMVNNESEFLKLLTDGAAEETPQSAPLHDSIVESWSKILKSGLPKETKQTLIKKYNTPANCRTIGAPILNAEIKSAMSTSAIKKDQHQVRAQTQLGAAISAVGQVLTTFLEAKKATKELEKNEISQVFQTICDIGKILTDSHHDTSITRRSFITPSFSMRLKTIADETGVDTFLFGETLGEKLKAAKECEKSGKDITRSAVVNTFKGFTNKDKPSTSSKNHLNWKPPSKKYNQRTSSRKGGQQWNRTNHRQSNDSRRK